MSLETLATIEEENLLANSRERGEEARSALRAAALPVIAQVRGRGLMLGVELDQQTVATMPGFQKNPDRPPSLQLVSRCQEEGLLLVPSGTGRVRWLPPLNVSREDIARGVEIFLCVLRGMASH